MKIDKVHRATRRELLIIEAQEETELSDTRDVSVVDRGTETGRSSCSGPSGPPVRKSTVIINEGKEKYGHGPCINPIYLLFVTS